jgi:hypothetical protein
MLAGASPAVAQPPVPPVGRLIAIRSDTAGLDRLRQRYDSLSRLVEATPLGNPRRTQLVDQLDKTGHDIASVASRSRSTGQVQITLGIVMDGDVQRAASRSMEEASRLLTAAMPRGMLG